MKEYAIGVDFGGTNTKVGLVHKSGRVLMETAFPTAESPKPPAFAQRVAREISKLVVDGAIEVGQVAGAGIGVPGLVDNVHGVIHSVTNVPGWNKLDAGSLFEKHWKLPVCVENDVNAMALGEYRDGAARGFANVVCVTLGTGVGGGLIIEHKLYHGATLTAGEIGHIVVESHGPLCGCGMRGCLEAFIGTKGLLSRAKALLKKNRGGVLHRWLDEGLVLTPHLLARAAHRRDKAALQVWDEAARYLGRVFGGLANFLNPDIFVVGGGISAAGGFFLNKVRSVAKQYAMSVPGKKLKIVRSGLGNRAGIMGAASLVFDRHGIASEA